MLLDMTLAGGGLAQLPTWLVQTPIQQGLLVPVLEQYAGAEMPIHVIWPRTRYIQPKIEWSSMNCWHWPDAMPGFFARIRARPTPGFIMDKRLKLHDVKRCS